MKNKIMKTGFILSIIIGIIFAKDMIETDGNIERKINPDLPVLKKDWEGNIVIDGKFHNDTFPVSAPLWDVIKWKFSKNPQRDEKRNDTFSLQVQPFQGFSKHDNSIIWLGHSSFLITIDGITLITDPCFFNLPSAKRKAPMPCPVDSLRNIDYLLVSHDHRDHFDKKSIESIIKNNPNINALIPLSGSRLFNGKKLSEIKIQEAGWFQEYSMTDSIRIIFLPAKHWGRRSLNDFNKTLWGSFLIISGKTKIFFAGDSAYDEQMFKEIRELFGEIDICLVPIAAYSPEFIMKREHMNPEEAIQVFLDLGGSHFLPMHYGTYDLSDEPISEPIERLKAAALRNSISDNIIELAIGEKFIINNSEIIND